jgi:hypothetical protein
MKKRALLVFALATLLWSASAAKAQGCSQCRDTAAGSTPQMRQALRRGILLLGLPAAGLFVAILVVARRIESLPVAE